MSDLCHINIFKEKGSFEIRNDLGSEKKINLILALYHITRNLFFHFSTFKQRKRICFSIFFPHLNKEKRDGREISLTIFLAQTCYSFFFFQSNIYIVWDEGYLDEISFQVMAWYYFLSFLVPCFFN